MAAPKQADGPMEVLSSPLRSPLREAKVPPLSTQGIVSRPPEGGEPSTSPLSPKNSASSAKAAVKAPAPVKPAVETENSRVVAWILRRRWKSTAVKRTAVAARFVEAAFSLISFSVMAADKERGWAAESFNHYKEYRYCVSINVIGFAYAVFQLYAEIHHMCRKKHIIPRPMRNYFNFAVDQIMAYLLISASSSATSRTNYWVVYWGTDPFPNMISGSVTVSFLAFLAFALSSDFIKIHCRLLPALAQWILFAGFRAIGMSDIAVICDFPKRQIFCGGVLRASLSHPLNKRLWWFGYV